MKKVKLIILALAMLGLVSTSSTTVFAEGFAPGEGMYVGIFAAASAGVVQPKVTTQGKVQGANDTGPTSLVLGTLVRAGGMPGANIGGVFETTDGGVGLAGIEGGGWIGYGYKMGDLYAGLEGEMAAGDVDFKITSSVPVILSGSSADGGLVTITEAEATKEWTGGMFGRLGYYVNKDTLLAFRGGVLVSKFNVKTTGTNLNLEEDYYGGGPSIGASLESTITVIDPNLSVRMDTVYTDFLTASVFGLGSATGRNDNNRAGHDSEITGAALSARIGLQYSFFDVNSLF